MSTSESTALQVQWWPLDRPIPYARNARVCPDAAIAKVAGSIHPTMKPVELIRRPILYHTHPGGLIYEPFSGSGTALIAAEEMGRVCYAMEQAPQFVDVAVARWEAYVGEEATLEGDGRSFADVAGERLP